jgi:hypothetical protein
VWPSGTFESSGFGTPDWIGESPGCRRRAARRRDWRRRQSLLEKSLNFRYPRRLMPVMCRFALHIALLVVWCIGFQPVAQAMGAHGAFAGKPQTTTQVTAAGSEAPHEAHSMHAQKCHMQQAAAMKAPALSSASGCPCGGHCVMPGCVGAIAAIAPMTFARAFDRFTDSYFISEVPVHPLAAHGLDLIRPPSKS